MTDRQLADEVDGHLRATTVSYPEYERRRAQGRYVDITKTQWWQAFNKLRKIGVDVPMPEPPPAVNWPEAPRDPVQQIRNAPGLGLNVTTRRDIEDVSIDGTGDTGVLFQKDAGGSSLVRCRMVNVAAANAVSYGKHAIYGKAPNLTISDVYASCSSYCASGFSMRMTGAVVRRSEVLGAPHALTYYETSTDRGEVLFEDVRGRFRGDTAVWMDAEVDYTQYVVQHFTFRRVAMEGNGAFLKVAGVRWRATVTIEKCLLNGKPVTAADCPGVGGVNIIP